MGMSSLMGSVYNLPAHKTGFSFWDWKVKPVQKFLKYAFIPLVSESIKIIWKSSIEHYGISSLI